MKTKERFSITACLISFSIMLIIVGAFVLIVGMLNKQIGSVIAGCVCIPLGILTIIFTLLTNPTASHGDSWLDFRKVVVYT